MVDADWTLSSGQDGGSFGEEKTLTASRKGVYPRTQQFLDGFPNVRIGQKSSALGKVTDSGSLLLPDYVRYPTCVMSGREASLVPFKRGNKPPSSQPAPLPSLPLFCGQHSSGQALGGHTATNCSLTRGMLPLVQKAFVSL